MLRTPGLPAGSTPTRSFSLAERYESVTPASAGTDLPRNGSRSHRSTLWAVTFKAPARGRSSDPPLSLCPITKPVPHHNENKRCSTTSVSAECMQRTCIATSSTAVGEGRPRCERCPPAPRTSWAGHGDGVIFRKRHARSDSESCPPRRRGRAARWRRSNRRSRPPGLRGRARNRSIGRRSARR